MGGDPLHTPVCDLLGIRVPVCLAPMAGGPSTPELAAAVTRAGGLGVLAATGLTAEAVADEVRRARELCDGGPVGVNVQLAPPTQGSGRREEVEAVVDEMLRELAGDSAERSLPGWRRPQADGAERERGPNERPATGPETAPARPADLVAAALAAGATAVSAALGDPAPLAPLARGAGVPLIAMVSTVEEARRSVEAGADVLVAQGAEAGGHRTTFELDGPLPLVGTMALVPRVVDAVGVPVLAAGGVGDGRGLAAALALGAQGAWIGTRFLLAEEAGVADAHRRTLARLRDDETFVTDSVTGRPARWVRNRATQALHDGPPHLGWGPQRAAVDRLRRAAASAGDAELLPMLAGQGPGLAAGPQPAEAIVADVVEGARLALARLAPPQ